MVEGALEELCYLASMSSTEVIPLTESEDLGEDLPITLAEVVEMVKKLWGWMKCALRF